MQPVRIQCTTLDDINWIPRPTWVPGDSTALYRVSIAAFGVSIPLLAAVLTPNERVRAGRYHQAHDQQRFIVARGVLRLLLSPYTSLLPTDIGFMTGMNKKPVVVGFPGLHYNVSHAGDWVLIAISPGAVGVDVERINPDFAYSPILAENFSEAERRYITGSAESRSRFYRLWTRKEALTKATAKGIDDDFDRIPSLDGAHLAAGDLLQTTDNWIVASFRPADGYVAAIACPAAGAPDKPVFYSVDPGMLDIIQ